MKTNLRGKIRDFIQSEEDKVGVKSPLTLGVAVGGVLFAKAIIGPPSAEAVAGHCEGDPDCPPRYFCKPPFIWHPNEDAWYATCM